MDQPSTPGEKKVCNCPHHKMGPWMLILIGAAVLLNAFNILTSMWTWMLIGIFLIVIGVTKLNAHKCRCCDKHWR